MSNDIKVQLLQAFEWSNDTMLEKAHDRIEELEAKLDEALDWLSKVRQYAISWDDRYLVERSDDILAKLKARRKGGSGMSDDTIVFKPSGREKMRCTMDGPTIIYTYADEDQTIPEGMRRCTFLEIDPYQREDRK
jgi:hypothetical protein